MRETVDLIRGQDIIGQGPVIDYLRNSIIHGKQHPAYLIYGPQKVGKRMISRWFIQRSLCLKPFQEADCDCQSCRSILFKVHPDFIDNFSEDTQANIGIDEIRQLINRIQQKPTVSSNVMALIPNIERLSESAMNSLLKTLEEPPGHAAIIMTTSRVQNILPTLRSRCQLLRCSLISESVLSTELENRGAEKALAQRVAIISNGAPGTALHLVANPDQYAKIEKELSVVDGVKSSSRTDKIRFVKERCIGTEVAQQREFVKFLSDHWLRVERGQLSKTVNTPRKHVQVNDQNALKSVRSIRRALNTIIGLRKNLSPTLLLESLLINYE